MAQLKLFEIHWYEQDEKNWVAANSLIDALKTYCSESVLTIHDFHENDEIKEVPESDWDKMTISNTDYDPNDPDDFETQTIAGFMKDLINPCIVAGTTDE